ncbi:MAG TPA: PAAR domain-containing protein, partial [Chitinophagaceae bacterium]|nr:PAAR domain-containing protein [Chitinophagaceae bacterium]
MPFAARISDMHVCPMISGVVPHVGGPIMPPGSATVLINSIPAAAMGDLLTCAGGPDTIVGGSATVFVNGKPAARVGDQTAHG